MADTSLALTWSILLLQLGVLSVSLAISYYLLRTGFNPQDRTLWERFRDILANVGEATETRNTSVEEVKEKRRGRKETKEVMEDEEKKEAMEVEEEETGLLGFLKEKLLSSQTQEAIDEIGYLIEHLSAFDLDGKPYHGSLFVLLAVIKKIENLPEFQAREHHFPDTSNVPKNILREVKYYSHFAFNIYSASKKKSQSHLARELNVAEEDLILHNFHEDDEESYCPKFVFLYNHPSRKLILSVRGTKSMKDCLLSMVCDDSPFLTGHAHTGILEGARTLWSLVSAPLRSAISLHPQYDFIVTGHSLGAGVAVMITMELLMGDQTLLRPHAVKCFAFAAPPVFRDLSQVPESVRSNITIIINNNDSIPRTSLGTIARLITSLRAVDELQLSLKEKIRIIRRAAAITRGDIQEKEKKEVTTGELSNLMEKVIKAVDSSTQDKFPYLQHPGTVIYLKKQINKTPGSPEDYIVICGEDESLTQPRRLRFFSGMLRDHSWRSYEEAFNCVSYQKL